MSLQDRCDALSYPPTHTYSVESLQPSGILTQRVRVIEAVAPRLFDGVRFLDVGCNKGWFSLRAASECEEVVGIDPSSECVALCRELAPSNCDFLVTSFGGYSSELTFDRIFIGNGPHYPFVEFRGFSYVEKLAVLSSGLVVTEGPVGMECSDMAACIPSELQSEFNRNGLMSAMKMHWKFVGIARSPSYTPDRYVIAWERVDDLLHCSMERYGDYLRKVYRKMAQWIEPSDKVVEVCIRHDRGVISREEIVCSQLDGLDLDPSRCPQGGYKANAITDVLPEADVYISTAIIHHTKPESMTQLLRNLRHYAGKRLIVTGPSRKEMPELIGDHEWHIDMVEFESMAKEAGWSLLHHEGIGINEPFCELLIVLGVQ